MKICWAKVFDVNFGISLNYNGDSGQEANVRTYIWHSWVLRILEPTLASNDMEWTIVESRCCTQKKIKNWNYLEKTNPLPFHYQQSNIVSNPILTLWWELNDGSSFETSRGLRGLEPSMTFNATTTAKVVLTIFFSTFWSS